MKVAYFLGSELVWVRVLVGLSFLLATVGPSDGWVVSEISWY